MILSLPSSCERSACCRAACVRVGMAVLLIPVELEACMAALIALGGLPNAVDLRL